MQRPHFRPAGRRYTALLLLCLLPLTASGSEPVHCPPPQRFIILPAASLSDSLQQLARNFDLLIAIPSAQVMPAEIPRQSGCGTLAFWLDQLLADTGLSYQLIGDTLVIRQSLPTTSRSSGQLPPPPAPVTEELVVTASGSERENTRNVSDLSGRSDFSMDISRLRQSGIYQLSSALELASGVKVEDNRYAIIRGMTGRYQSIRINGGELPSLDPAGQNFPLDFIPIGILNSIDLKKSVYADAPGQASAGIVSLNTTRLPQENFIQLAVSGIDRSQSNNTQVLQGYISPTDWQSHDDGSRRIPAELMDNAHEGGVVGLDAASRETLGETIVGDMGLYRARSNGSSGLDLSSGLSGHADRFRWGGTLSVSLRDRWQQTQINSTAYSTGTGYSGQSADFHHEDSQHQRTDHITGLNALLSLGTEINDAHYLGFNTLLLRQSTHHAELTDTLGKDVNNLPLSVAYRRNIINWTERQLRQYQLYGQHSLTDNTAVNWQLSRTSNRYDRPHDLDYRYFSLTGDEDYTLQLAPGTTSIGWRHMTQQTQSSGLHLNHLYVTGINNTPLTGEIKIGWERNQRQRYGYNLLYSFSATGDITTDAELMQQTNPTDILTAQWIQGEEDISGFILTDNALSREEDQGLNGRFYGARQHNQAGYLLNDLDLSEAWRLISGIRRETNRTEAELWDASAENYQPLSDEALWLPSVSVEYLPGNHTLQLNYSQTLVWPQLNELLPVVYEDPDTRTKTTGNPELRRSDVHNWNIAWEYQPGNDLRLATALYLKRIRNPIEGVFTEESEQTDAATFSNYTYRNTRFASVRGYELETDYALSLYRGHQLNILARYAGIRSETATAIDEQRPLQGQPRYISAAQLQYIYRQNTSLTLRYKRSGTQLYITSDREDLPAIYQQPRNQLDMTFSQFSSPFRLSLSLNNLLNTRYQYVQGDYQYLSYRSGREWQLTIDARF